MDVQAVHAEKQNVCIQPGYRFLGKQSLQRKRIPAQRAACENCFYRSPRQLRGDVYRIRNNRNIPKVTQRAANGRRSRAGIKDHDLTLFDQSGGASCDAQLLLAPKPFFFEQCWVFERSFPSWQRATMSPVDKPVTV